MATADPRFSQWQPEDWQKLMRSLTDQETEFRAAQKTIDSQALQIKSLSAQLDALTQRINLLEG